MNEHLVFGLLAEALSWLEFGPEQEIDLTWPLRGAPLSAVLTCLGGTGTSGSISLKEVSRLSRPTSIFPVFFRIKSFLYCVKPSF